MIYDQRNGFQNELSNLWFLKSNGKVSGAGIGMYLEGMPEVKFSFGNFREKLATNPAFKAHFEKLTKENLRCLIKEATSFQNTPEKIDEVLSEEPSGVQILNEDI